MSNIGLYKAFDELDIDYVKTAVGDRHVVEEIREHGYNIGGEQSGHVVLFDYHNTGDGMLTGLQLLYVMKATGKSLSELAAPVKIYPQKLVNVKVTDKNAWKGNDKIQAIIAEVESEMGSNGRVLVRPSGTESLLRVMAEAPTEELVHSYVDRIVDVVEDQIGL